MGTSASKDAREGQARPAAESPSASTSAEGRPKRFSTFRRTAEDARAQLRTTLRGGLNRDLLDFMWMSNGGRAPKTHHLLHEVIKAVVRDYPALFMQAVDLSFRAYEKAPGAMPSSTVHQRIKKDLSPAMEQMRATLDALPSRSRHSLVRKTVAKTVSAGTGSPRKMPRISFERFAEAFETATGPWLAERLLDNQFRTGFMDTLAVRVSNALAPVAVVDGKRRPRSPRDKVVEAGRETKEGGGAPSYLKRVFSFRMRQNSAPATPATPASPRDGGAGADKAKRSGSKRKGKKRGGEPPQRAKTMPVRRSASIQEH